MNQIEALRPVESSLFSHAGYDDNTWTLFTRFKSSGETRAYRDVQPEVADTFLGSKSLGKWWTSNVKGHPDDWPFDVVPDPFAEAKPAETEKAQGGMANEGLHEWGISNEDIRRADPTWIGPDEKAALASQPKPGEVLGPWEAPKTAVAAIAMLQDRDPEIQALIRQNQEHGKSALACRVTDAPSHSGAALQLTTLVKAKDRAVAMLDPIRAILYETYKVAGERQKAAVDPLDTAITHVKRTMNVWENEQERLRQEKIKQERERAEAEARERQRAQSEQLTLREIDDALQSGDTTRAEQLVHQPIEVPLPYVAPAMVEPTYESPEGVSKVDNWVVDRENFDLVEFLRAVKDGKYPLEKAAMLILPNFPALADQAGSLRTAFDVPGFHAKNEPIRRVSRGKKSKN